MRYKVQDQYNFAVPQVLLPQIDDLAKWMQIPRSKAIRYLLCQGIHCVEQLRAQIGATLHGAIAAHVLIGE